MLFEYWNLEPIYVQILKELDFETKNENARMNEYINSLDVVRTAVNVKEIFTQNSMARACEILEEIHLNVDDFVHVASRLKEKINLNKV